MGSVSSGEKWWRAKQNWSLHHTYIEIMLYKVLNMDIILTHTHSAQRAFMNPPEPCGALFLWWMDALFGGLQNLFSTIFNITQIGFVWKEKVKNFIFGWTVPSIVEFRRFNQMRCHRWIKSSTSPSNLHLLTRARVHLDNSVNSNMAVWLDATFEMSQFVKFHSC